MQAIIAAITAFFAGLFPATGSVENITIQSLEGRPLEITINSPNPHGERLPAIVLAPGHIYHKNLPLIEEFANKAAAAGFIVFRFNWTNFTANPSNPEESSGMVTEKSDLKKVIEFARADSRVDTSRMVLAGKSMGSLVSYSVFNNTDIFRGLILLTPLCTKVISVESKGENTYPKIAAVTKPVAFVLGNEDVNCTLPMLYDLVKDTKGNVAVSVFGGGHYFAFRKAIDSDMDERDKSNLDAAVTAATNWARIFVSRPN